MDVAERELVASIPVAFGVAERRDGRSLSADDVRAEFSRMSSEGGFGGGVGAFGGVGAVGADDWALRSLAEKGRAESGRSFEAGVRSASSSMRSECAISSAGTAVGLVGRTGRSFDAAERSDRISDRSVNRDGASMLLVAANTGAVMARFNCDGGPGEDERASAFASRAFLRSSSSLRRCSRLRLCSSMLLAVLRLVDAADAWPVGLLRRGAGRSLSADDERAEFSRFRAAGSDSDACAFDGGSELLSLWGR